MKIDFEELDKLVEDSKSIVDGIWGSITRIEETKKLLEVVSEGKTGIVMPDGNLVDLNVLSDDQFDKINNCIADVMKDNMQDAIFYLHKVNRINRKPATINEEFEAAVQEMVSQNDVKEDVKPWRDEAVLRRMYITEDKSAAQIAEELGCKATDVYNGLEKCRIPAKKTYKKRGQAPEPEQVVVAKYPEMTKEAVKQYYITDGHTLDETARFFGKTKKEMHDFIEKQGILKCFPKANDPFINQNKISKDDFKKHMMKGR